MVQGCLERCCLPHGPLCLHLVYCLVHFREESSLVLLRLFVDDFLIFALLLLRPQLKLPPECLFALLFHLGRLIFTDGLDDQ